MGDSLACCGSVLWNLVNYNDRIINLNFKEMKRRLTAKEYFEGFIFESSTTSTSRFRESDYVYF